jgi:hypothetical protein
VVVGSGKASAAIHDFAGLPDKGRFTGPTRADSGTWDQVVCTPQIRPGLQPTADTTYKCVTSEGKVFYTKIPQLAGGGGSGGR